MVHCIESQGPSWRQQWIPFGIDNQSFEKSAQKSWSRAERLNLLLKRLFVLQIKFDCLIRFFWLKSEDNSMADPLSREDGLEAFLAEVQRQAFVVPPAVIQGMPDAGRVRNLDMSAPFNAADMEVLQGQSRQRVDMAALSRMLPAVVFIQSMLRGWLVRRDLGRFAPPRGTAFGILARAYLPEKTPEKAPGDSVREVGRWAAPAISMPSVYSRPKKATRRGTRSSSRVSVALVAALVSGAAAMPARDGYSAQQASVPYTRAMLYEGLPAHNVALLDELAFTRAPDRRRPLSSWLRTGFGLTRTRRASRIYR